MKKKSQIPNITEFVAPPQPVAYTVTNGGSSSCPENSSDYYTDRNTELGDNYRFLDPTLDTNLDNAKKELKDLCDRLGVDDNSPQRQEFIDGVKKESQQRYDEYVADQALQALLAGEYVPVDSWALEQLADASNAPIITPLDPLNEAGSIITEALAEILNPNFLPESSCAWNDTLYTDVYGTPIGPLYSFGNEDFPTYAAAAAAAGGGSIIGQRKEIPSIVEAANRAIAEFNTQLPLGQTPLPPLKSNMSYEELQKVFPLRTMFDRTNDKMFGMGGDIYNRVKFCPFVSNKVGASANDPRRNLEHAIRDVLNTDKPGSALAQTEKRIQNNVLKLCELQSAQAAARAAGVKFKGNKNGTTAKMNKELPFKKVGIAIAVGLAIATFVQRCIGAETAENENLNQECARKNKEIADAVKKFNDAKEALEKDVDEKNKKTKEDKPDLDSRCTPDGTPPPADNGAWPGSGPIDDSWPESNRYSNAEKNERLERVKAVEAEFKELLKPPCDIKPIDCRLYTIDQPQGNTN